MAVHADGSVAPMELPPENVVVLHRAHSGGDHYVELGLRMPALRLDAVRVRYSCAVHELSAATLELIQSARKNLAARGRR